MYTWARNNVSRANKSQLFSQAESFEESPNTEAPSCHREQYINEVRVEKVQGWHSRNQESTLQVRSRNGYTSIHMMTLVNRDEKAVRPNIRAHQKCSCNECTERQIHVLQFT